MDTIELHETDVPGASLENPPDQCSNALLRRWLKCHGLSTTGVKAKLVDRVNVAIASGKKVIPGIDEGKWYNLKKDKLSTKDQETDDTAVHHDHAFPTQGWKSFPSRDVPKHFAHGHIYHHMVESISHTSSSDRNKNSDSSSSCSDDGYATTAKPFQKGQRLMESGFVENIEDNSHEGAYFMRAHVHHSMKKENALKVLIGISKRSGFVLKAECNCRASALGRCAHVAAVLLKLHDFTDKHGHTVEVPSTSRPCNWDTGKKRKKDPTAIHVKDYSLKKKQDRLMSWDPRPQQYRIVTRGALNRFVIDLQVGPFFLSEIL